MFLFKKIFSPLLFPLNLCLLLLVIGLMFLWSGKRQKAGKMLVLIGTLLLLLFSFPPVSLRLVGSLESQYPPVLEVQQLKSIVVLGAGHNSSPQLPKSSRLNGAGFSRLIEGIRLHKAIPGSRLILSGGKVFDAVPNAVTMAEVAELLGVEKRNMILESKARDTQEEAQEIAKLITSGERFYLVTTASHMPRSMALFQKYGMQPVAAPTDFVSRPQHQPLPLRFMPGVGSLNQSERFFYERLGRIWSTLTLRNKSSSANRTLQKDANTAAGS